VLTPEVDHGRHHAPVTSVLERVALQAVHVVFALEPASSMGRQQYGAAAVWGGSSMGRQQYQGGLPTILAM
jgi:hypothetical protein